MNISEEISKIEELSVGFDINKAEEKLRKILDVIKFIETNMSQNASLEKTEIELVLNHSFGIIYEIGFTKQNVASDNEVLLCEKMLKIARLQYGKTKTLLPFLNLCMLKSLDNKNYHDQLLREINDIENLK